MKYLFYTNSQSAWEGLYEAMLLAKHSIYMEMYIFVDDTKESLNMVDLLSQKSSEGVLVKIVLDAFGSLALSGKSIKKLRDSGVEVLFYSKFFRRLHKKNVIVDEQVGFLGGVNIHDSARWWNDLLVRLEGKIVQSLLRSFRRSYKACGGANSVILAYKSKKKAVLGRTRIWMMEHFPGIRKPRLKDAYVESIHKAKNKITLVTPYFMPHKWLIKLFEKVMKKGIEVEIILPKNTDSSILTRANLYYVNLLAQAGVKFFQTPTMNHAKLLLIDNSLALVGSQNIDALSFDFNAEAGIFFTDGEMIKSLRLIILRWKSEAAEYQITRVTIWDKLLSLLVRFFQPIL